MRQHSFLFGLVAILLGTISSAVAAPPTDLVHHYALELDAIQRGRQQPLTPELTSQVASFQWVLVDGIFGDLARNLYEHVIPVLEQHSGSGRVTTLRPSSMDSLDTNADALARSFEQEFLRTGRRLVIVAHSRGAAETLLALLRNPSLVESGQLHAVFLVQGAFSGSPLATLVRDRIQRFCEGYLPFLLAEAGCAAFSLLQDSVRTLVPAEAIELRENASGRLSADERRRLASVVSFVRGRAGGSGVRKQLQAGGLYLSFFHGENDGVLLTEHQKVDGLGSDLGMIETDHFGLLGTTAPTERFSMPSDSPTAFARALLRSVGQPAP